MICNEFKENLSTKPNYWALSFLFAWLPIIIRGPLTKMPQELVRGQQKFYDCKIGEDIIPQGVAFAKIGYHTDTTVPGLFSQTLTRFVDERTIMARKPV